MQIHLQVLAEATRYFRGEFFTSFAHTYSQNLSSRGIPKMKFQDFLDGLSEAFLANSVYKAAGLAELGICAEHIHPVQWADIAMNAGASVDRVTS